MEMVRVAWSSVSGAGRAEASASGGPQAQRDLGRTIVGLIDSRDKTDRMMSVLWAAVPACIFWIFGYQIIRVVTIFIGVDFLDDEGDLLSSVSLASYAVSLPLFGILFGAMIFKMLQRTNLHLSREDSLRASVMAYLRNAASSAGRDSQVLDDLLRLSAFDGQSVTYEKRHNPVLWGVGVLLLFCAYPLFILLVVLSLESDHSFVSMIIGSMLSSLAGLMFIIASAYIINSLMRTIYTHDVRWRGFTASTMAALHTLGMSDGNEWRHEPVKERSMMLFVVLTIVTMGLFLFYWFYVLVEDPNKHFKEQRRFEDMLRRAVAGTQ